jgi:putative NADPH-quinone reductase
MGRHILIIQGHPDRQQQHLCHALADAYRAGAQAAGHTVATLEPARFDFPLLSNAEDWQHGPVPPALEPAQQAIKEASHLVFIYPLWLGEMPALLKGFLEQVARPGFALDPASRNPLRSGLLQGRSARIIVTMGMPALVYRWFYRAHSLKCLKRNILGFSGIRPVHATLVGRAAAMAPEQVARWDRTMRKLGAGAR